MGERRESVRVVVVGDRGTGKSSLISAAATEKFPENFPPPVLQPTSLPADFYPDGVPLLLIDTSSRALLPADFYADGVPRVVIDTSSSLESRGKLNEELMRADAVVLTYACDEPETLDHVSSFWLHEFRRLEVKVPVILVGCKLDLRDESHLTSLEQVMAPIMQQFREIETCIECSAANLVQVPEVFFYAQKAVLHPTGPLFDQETQSLKPRCIRALKRIFIVCDHDMDGSLNDVELNDFQVKCFNAPLQPDEILGVKRVVQEKLYEGVNEHGLTLTGFLFLHALFIEKGRLETTWTVLRQFGYDDDIKLRRDQFIVPSKKAIDQSIELTSEAIEFLNGVFSLFDHDKDGALYQNEFDDLFSTAPESPWDEPPYSDAVARTAMGGISLNGFLSEFALMTLLDPVDTLANLVYLGYARDPASALRVTRKRTLNNKKQQTDRNVFQCYVFGPKNSGKSTLLKSFLVRSSPDNNYAASEEHYAANIVDQLRGNKKTLILREIPEDTVKKLLSNRESMAACDVAVFIYDSSDEYSLKRASELLMEVARHSEESGFTVPSLLVAAKDDLGSYPMAMKDSAKICEDMGIDAPIHFSVKERDHNYIFGRIVSAAMNPHLSVPETELGRNQKHQRQLVSRSLLFVSVGTAVAMVALATYRAYAARKHSSN